MVDVDMAAAPLTLTVTPAYGWVVLVLVASYFLTMYLGVKVGMMRKKIGFPYPKMYSEKDDLFNCYQRAHQNTMEVYPQVMLLMLVGGLHCPCLAAAGGGLWCVSRIVYAHGYYTGKPAARNYGAFGYLGILSLLYCCVSLALSLLL